MTTQKHFPDIPAALDELQMAQTGALQATASERPVNFPAFAANQNERAAQSFDP